MQLLVLDEPSLPNPFMEIDDSDTEEVPGVPKKL